MSMNSRHSGAESRRIIRRLVVEGELMLQTPAHFGGGENDGTTVLLLEDALTEQPLLPGASLAGALRHHLLRRERGYRAAESPNTLTAVLFGEAYDNNRGSQSRVIADDALGRGTGHLLESRDGVKIDGAFRTADEGALYTFNVWAAGTIFNLHFELCLYEDDEATELISAFATALEALGNGEIPLGARKHRGYGRAHVAAWRAHDYQFDTVNGLVDWLQNGAATLTSPANTSIFALLNTEPLGYDLRQFVRLEARFGLEDSLLIRANSDVADMAHLMTRDHAGKLVPVLTGTSVTGALRARALKIANTLGLREAVVLIDAMFGQFGGDEELSPDSIRTASRVIVEEHPIQHGVTDYVQNRVRIDRFTGGAFDTGLFGQQPVFSTDATEVTIKLEFQYPAYASERDCERFDAQVGLLFLLLKDAWTGDLPFGGESSIGRGRLSGRYAEITILNRVHNAQIIMDGNPSLTSEQRAMLSSYVDALQRERKGGSK